MGLGSLIKKANPLAIAGGAVLGGVGGLLQARAANKAAKNEASNQNKMNAWKNKLDKANWENEDRGRVSKNKRSTAFRQQLAASIVKNSKYGLDKLLPGFFQQQQDYTAPVIQSPYEAAGPVPVLQASTGSALGSALSGAAAGGVQGAQIAQTLRG